MLKELSTSLHPARTQGTRRGGLRLQHSIDASRGSQTFPAYPAGHWFPLPRAREATVDPQELAAQPRNGALTCSEHMEFIPGICSEFICICPAMGFMFWTLVLPPAMETVMLMLLYMPC